MNYTNDRYDREQRTSAFDEVIAKLVAQSISEGGPSAMIARIRLGVIIKLDRFHTRPPR